MALIGGEVKLGAVEHDQPLVEAQSCVGRRWLGPAQHQNVPAAWQGVGQFTHDVVQGRTGRQLLYVVEHQHGRRPDRRDQRLGVPPRKAGQTGPELRRQCRQCDVAATGRLAQCQAKVVEDVGDVGIVGIELQPEVTEASLAEVAAGKGRLAGAGRTGDPDYRHTPQRVESGEEPRSEHRAIALGPRSLGEDAGTVLQWLHDETLSAGFRQVRNATLPGTLWHPRTSYGGWPWRADFRSSSTTLACGGPPRRRIFTMGAGCGRIEAGGQGEAPPSSSSLPGVRHRSKGICPPARRSLTFERCAAAQRCLH